MSALAPSRRASSSWVVSVVSLVLIATATAFSGFFAVDAEEAKPVPNAGLAAMPVEDLLTQLTADRSDAVQVQIPATLRVAGERLYSVNVTVRNESQTTVQGPLRLTVEKIEPAGLKVAEPAGLVDGKTSFLIASPAEQLPPNGTAGPFKIVFQSEERLSVEARRTLKLTCRVLGLKAQTVDQPEDSPAGVKKPAESGTESPKSVPLAGTGAAGQPAGNPGAPENGMADELAPGSPPQPSDEELERVFAIQDRATDALMEINGVTGTGTGIGRDGQLYIQVLAERAGVQGVPDSIEGVPVKVVVTGSLSARWQTADENPRDRFDRPVPIGVSIGNIKSGSTGTLSCRVRDSAGRLYVLSNNHVIALSNSAKAGDLIVQPGRVDATDPLSVQQANNGIAKLTSFVTIRFGWTSNKVDAAIARLEGNSVGIGTPVGGYGNPRKQTRSPALNLLVQKYGRTTSLTTGKITSLNATVNVNYGSGRVARFIGQIVVTGDTAGFLNPGDSGSLLVDNDRRPVGLLYASSNGGTIAIANKITDVTSALKVTIEGD